MDVKRAYRFRFYPTPEQAVMLARTFGCARFAYNHMLRRRTDAWHQRQERMGYHETSAALTVLKKADEYTWLNEVSSVPVQQALCHLQTAFTNFFAKRAKYPTFRSKHDKQSAEYTTSAFKWDGVTLKSADARRDFLHKLSTRLINENQVIAIESLSVSHMQKSRRRAKSISDASWSEFTRQLEYKAQWYGRTLIGIDRWYPSSKRCSDCGHTVARMPLKVRAWTCPECGAIHDRDINAACNVLAAGLAVSAHGESVSPMSR
ncbi:transposase [Burkholderia pyrrocinia]|uniref:Transposase n=1 Tax=Burkholderia pyrrocinia TaxID=60550 RepID=A0A2Z5MSX0_BURPY|nr:RNA-guided endonuclease TnpB family protein [Burkholderia pyrrocinia]AXF20282.1 transposase [Burkholderia pyrrocinia]